MKRRNLVPTLAGVLFTLFVAGNLYAGGAKESAKPAPVAAPEKKTAKYVFFFVGDGLAMPQISATEAYTNALSSKDVNVKRLVFSQFPVTGLCTTYDAGSLITDSASAELPLLPVTKP
jgi:alkaline phosphatase